jgi:threonine synthase
MQYISTRDQKHKFSFEDILLKGLADDGGLFVPEFIPELDEDLIIELLSKDYQNITFEIVKLFAGDTFEASKLSQMIDESYCTFRDRRVTPLKNINDKISILELHHGPTLAFKDLAMQLLSRMIEYVLDKKKKRASIICATSGDTGGAAVSAFANKNNIDLYVLFPKNRISEVQRRFMTTNSASNVHVISIDGTFDDCQNIVKALFKDKKLSDSVQLTAVNSINWARIMIQVMYYFSAYSQLDDKSGKINFIVPTGNFGDIFAGYIAKKMGLSINQLVIATNKNNILEKCFKSGDYEISGVIPTVSPSMDIQISSNFERLLFDLVGRKSKIVCEKMADLANHNRFKLDNEQLTQFRASFGAGSLDDSETLEIIKKVYLEYSEIIDPHTAVAIGVQFKNKYEQSVILSTAHPAKFPETVDKAIGKYPELPIANGNIYEQEERIISKNNKLNEIKEYILNNYGK